MFENCEEQIKEEVYKCSKCGLCQSVCPVYRATKNEMYLPRGRNIVLNNFYNNGKQLSKKFTEDLDVCLYCNECKRFCPSNIDSAKIYTYIKSKNSNYNFAPKYKKLLKIASILKYGYKYFPFKGIFVLSMWDFVFDEKAKRNKSNKTVEKGNVLYFQGCINKYVNPSDKNASLNILEKLGYNVVKISSDCCGLPYISDGDIKAFEENAKTIINSIPENIQYIVCSCDSCYETLRQIPEIKEKLIRIDELLKINHFEIPQNDNAVYHKPIFREDNCYIPNKIINKKGICSLTENYFMLKYPKISKQILENNFYSYEEIDDKIVVTSCLLSSIGLKKCISDIKSTAKVYTYSEYINFIVQ